MTEAHEVKRVPSMSISQVDRGQLRHPEGDNGGAIVQVGPKRRAEAIERLVSTGRSPDRAAAERFMHYARTNAVRLDGLWSRLGRNGKLTASVLAVPSPGRTAMVFATHARSETEVGPIGGLIDHACREIAGWDVDLAQALLEPGEALETRSFIEAGFRELAVLSYLERPLSRSDPPPPPQWPAEARVQPYREALDDLLVRILEATYEQTLDCPGLYGLRRTRDIVVGHKATGQFDPSLWTLLWVDEQPAGVVLLNPFPAQRTIELVYIGLAPFARGRGLGRQLLRHALALVSGRRERSLTLAVDQRNTPALALYQDEGLRPVVHRVALIRPLTSDR